MLPTDNNGGSDDTSDMSNSQAGGDLFSKPIESVHGVEKGDVNQRKPVELQEMFWASLGANIMLSTTVR